jgi:hypothetical protein
MPTFLANPVNVSNGTTLTSSLYNTYLGNSGTLQYLYETLNTYIGYCGYEDYTNSGNFTPTVIQYRKTTQSIPHNTNTTIIFDEIDSGFQFWDGVAFDTQTGGCYITNNAPVLILCTAITNFVANATGTRGVNVNATATNATVNRLSTFARSTGRAVSTGVTSLQITVPILITPNIGSGPSYNTPYFKVGSMVYQNSGGALVTNTTVLTINKLPSC